MIQCWHHKWPSNRMSPCAGTQQTRAVACTHKAGQGWTCISDNTSLKVQTPRCCVAEIHTHKHSSNTDSLSFKDTIVSTTLNQSRDCWKLIAFEGPSQDELFLNQKQTTKLNFIQKHNVLLEALVFVVKHKWNCFLLILIQVGTLAVQYRERKVHGTRYG